MLRFRRSLRNNIFTLTLILIIIFSLLSSTFVTAETTSEEDYDSDGLNDIYEDYLGSDSTDSSDVISFNISGSSYYLVDILKDGIYDNFCSPLNGYYSDVVYEEGIPYLDFDGDGKWDYTYQNGTLLEHSTTFNFGFGDFFNNFDFFNSIWFYLVVVAAVIAVILIVLFKKGIFFIYEEEYIIEK